MKCVNHPETDATASCSNCSAALCKTCATAPDEKGGHLCNRCQALQAVQDISDDALKREVKKEFQETKKEKKKKWQYALQWAILGICVVIMIYQASAVLSAIKRTEKPIRHGTYATDQVTDRCIHNLWAISRQLQRGKMPDGTITCPASGASYYTDEKEDNIIARCPNPGKHGFSELRVDKQNPIPKVRK